MTRGRSPREGWLMKLRVSPLVSLARSGVVTRPAAAGRDVTLPDLSFRHGAEVGFVDDVPDVRPQAIGTLFTWLRGRGREGEERRFLGRLRIGTPIAPTRQ
jgi:hypothetical protein